MANNFNMNEYDQYSRQRSMQRAAARRKAEQRRRRRNRNIGLICAVLVVAVVGVGVAIAQPWNAIAPKATENTASTSTNLDAGTAKDAAATDKDKKKQNKKEEKTDTRAASFTVVPGQVPGSDSASDEKVVYLTIDDGPSPLTAQILEILDKYNAKATFFVTGRDPDSYHFIKEAYEKGHTIGLHTYSHDYASVYASDAAYFEDLDAIGQVVKEQIGYVPCFIRFPGGSSNGISANYNAGIMSRLVNEVHDRGYQYYDWNVSVGDGGNPTAEQEIEYATGHEYNNIMLLCHDSAPKQATADALPAIIEHYQSRGYEFRALDRNSYAAHHGVNN